MSGSSVLKSVGLLAALMFSGAPWAQAEQIDFNEFVQGFQGAEPVVSGSLTFTTMDIVLGVWLTAPLQEDDSTSNAFNGTPYLMDAASFSVQRTDHAPFRLDSFQLALGWYQQQDAQPITLTYDLAVGGTLVQTPTIYLSTFTTIAPGLTINRMTLSPVGLGYVSLDNVQISTVPVPVPEPGRGVILALGLAVTGFACRRRRRLG